MKTRKRDRRGIRGMFAERLEDRRLLTAAPHPFDLSTLDGDNGFRLDGVPLVGASSIDVSRAGDINSDGFDDVVVSAKWANPIGNATSVGAAFVVYGTGDGFSPGLDLATLDGTNGFRIDGTIEIAIGYAVDAAGDFNGDGIDDLLLGTPGADWNGPNTGGAYVLFGNASGFSPVVVLEDFDGTNGFRLDGYRDREETGIDVSGAGDVNGDGFDDIVVGSVSGLFNSSPGSSYIVFGTNSGIAPVVQLDALDGTNGFRLDGATNGDDAGRAVSEAGDVNGDGFDDVLIGAPGAQNSGSVTGSTYVFFGHAEAFPAAVNLGTLDGSNGFRLDGITEYEGSGGGLSGVGDLNGDGLDDIVIGAGAATQNGRQSGSAYIWFGKTGDYSASMHLAALDGTNGFRVDGVKKDDHLANSGNVGDFNRDGFDDLLISAPQFWTSDDDAGASYVIFGRPGGFDAQFDVTTLDGNNGFRLDGFGLGNLSGRSVSGAGDINGDGFDDIIIGADGPNPQSNGTGSAYVVFGSAVGVAPVGVTAEFANGVLTVTGTDAADSILISGDHDQYKLIKGLDGTLINGLARQSFRGNGRIDRVVIDTGAGQDVVIFDQVVGGTMQVDTGAGKDYVEMKYGDYQSASLELDTGRGDDHVVLIGSHNLAYSVVGTWVTTGRGNDRIEQRGDLGNGVFVNMGIGDDVLQSDVDFPSPGPEYSFDGGEGHDRLTATGNFGTPINFEEQSVRPSSDYFFGGDLRTRIVTDPKIGNILVIKGKDHFDHDLRLSSVALGQVTVESTGYDATIDGAAGSVSFDDIARVKVVTGSGQDSVHADGLLLSDKLIVRTGLGDDTVQVVGGQLGKLKIDTGGGDDTVLLDALSVDRKTKVVTGWGEDVVSIRDSIFARKMILEGGLDDDTLHLLGVNLFNKGLDEDLEL